MPPVWRELTVTDLPSVMEIAAKLHPAYPERMEIFADKLRAFPAGCRLLADSRGVWGYAFAHPWRVGYPPLLDRELGEIAVSAPLDAGLPPRSPAGAMPRSPLFFYQGGAEFAARSGMTQCPNDAGAERHPVMVGGKSAPLDKQSAAETSSLAADCLHLHDIAILPAQRGGGHVRSFLAHLIVCCDSLGIAALTLVATKGKDDYWAHHGFRTGIAHAGLESYGDGVLYMTASSRAISQGANPTE